MIKKVTDIQKKEILKSFKKGLSIKELSLKFDFSAQTITRQIKNLLGEKKFKEFKSLINKNAKNKFEENTISFVKEETKIDQITTDISLNNEEKENLNEFYEIIPLINVKNIENQKELASYPFKKIEFPKVVYILVDKAIELEIKLLKEFPEWSFLPSEDLGRNAIEIFSDHRKAKVKCIQNQKVIKVPNPNVFFKDSKCLWLMTIILLVSSSHLFI
mgnify:CR=1 FL=1